MNAARSGQALLSLLLLALCLSLTPRGLPAQSAVDRQVVELSFRGNQAFPDDRLAEAISTEQTRCRTFVLAPFCWLTDWGFAHVRSYLDEGAIPADLLRLRIFYRRRGYRDVAVDTVIRRLNGDARVTFEIDEGRPIRLDTLELQGFEEVLDPAEVRESFSLQPGDPFDLVALDRAKEELADRFRNRGYVDAAVLDEHFIPADSRRVELTLKARPGPRARYGTITVQGAATVGEEVVREHLSFESGQIYRQNEILESQRELFRLESVRFASLQTSRPPGTDTLVDVAANITAAPTRTVRAGVGVTTTDCVQTQATLTHRDFLGGARRLRLSGSLSNLLAAGLAETFPCTGVSTDPVFQNVNFQLGADLRQPGFLSPANTLEGGLFLERETVPDLFVRRSRGGQLTFTRRLRPRMSLSLNYRPELTSFDDRSADVFFCVSFGFCQDEDIRALTDPRWLVPLTAGWSYDRTNASFSPTGGYYVDAELEWADEVTGSDYQYARLNLNAANFEQLAPGLVLATRFRAGFLEALGGQRFGTARGQVVHPRKRFFAGGAQSVRGLGQNLLGPRVLLLRSSRCAERFGTTTSDLARCARALADSSIDPQSVFAERPVGGDAAFEANIEFRGRIGGKWTLVGFVDVGQVWSDISHLEAPVATPGIGFRYDSPVGPLRLDFGYNPTTPDRLPVIAEYNQGPRLGELVELGETVEFDPFAYDDPGGFTQFVRRLRVHVSIGQAF